MSVPVNDTTRLIARLHAETKAIIIRAEELGIKEQTFPQPLYEQRSAFDHLMRAVLAEEPDAPDRTPDQLAEYQADCQSKALGHMYRAFFDASDWLSTELRTGIANALSPDVPVVDRLTLYPYDDVVKVFPKYPEWRSDIVEIGRRISALRNHKDITALPKNCKQVEEYVDCLNRLEKYYVEIDAGIPDLEKLARERRRQKTQKQLWDILKILLAAAVAGLLGFLAGKSSGS